MSEKEKHSFTNRLIHEKSPYLQQHAHNPVDWFPWGADAFEAARGADKPIFLSIGYSTCHWCHVMEREVFEDEHLAKMLNDTFVNIKVDREEQPDVDALYMEFAQSMLAGAAGWPLNLVLTPDLKPIYAATYLPPMSQPGILGMPDFIQRIKRLWQSDDRMRVVEQADHLIHMFQSNTQYSGTELPGHDVLVNAGEALFKLSDPIFGGMLGRPKFPVGFQIQFFFHYAQLMKDGRALFCAEKTLDMMARGGIYDQLGGGFARYSVDEQWLIPHFEKMLYDNAMLIETYSEGYQILKKSAYRKVVEETVEYIEREMTHPEGAFYSAQDADTEGREGYFYTWRYDEILDALKGYDSILFCSYYGITPQGNFEGRNVLHVNSPPEEFAKTHGMELRELNRSMEQMKKVLFNKRGTRTAPFKDDKILAGWNGLMIHALSYAAFVFDEPKYIEMAMKAMKFIRKNLWKDGRLYRRFREGEMKFRAGLDEYASMIRASISFFEASGESEWLAWAMDMTQTLEEEFKIPGGAFYFVDDQEISLPLRRAHYADGAEPSGNALHTENLLRLYQITWNEKYRIQAEDAMKTVQPNLEVYAPGYCFHLLALQRYMNKNAPTVVVALNQEGELHRELAQMIPNCHIPHLTIIWKKFGDTKLEDLIPELRNYQPIEGSTAAYICRQGSCRAPMTDFSEIISDLHNKWC
jgi:uncharacterized protein YyaL (SSP411 family)